MDLATDEELAACLECPREVYVAGDDALRRAFASSTIEHWTSQTYADGQTTRYNEGSLSVGDRAPDFQLQQVVGEALVNKSLLSFGRVGAAFLVLDFGSFS
jgi:hypothetical protein